MINSYQVAVFNRRGGFSPSAGKTELKMALDFKDNAEYLNPDYPKTARIFYNLYKDYKSCNISYENDLKYSSYACNIVVNHILDCILINTANSYIFANCI